MYSCLKTLSPSAWILDVGSSKGSFDPSITSARVVHLDIEKIQANQWSLFVQATASSLPFREEQFDVIIANHCLEHFDSLDASVRELGRVIKPNGSLFVSVPDASTLTDKLYRWLAKGGGHVNPFIDDQQLATKISSAINLNHVATILLYSGLSFLNRKNMERVQRKLRLLGGGNERLLMLATLLFRWVDWKFGTRLSVYVWAFYFGNYRPSSLAAHENVCVGCGYGVSARELAAGGLRGGFPAPVYVCAVCGSSNYYSAWHLSAADRAV